jgi:DNA-binding beta-propeller fold protein YncE
MTFDDRSRQGALGQHAEDDGREESGLRDRHGWRTGEGLTRRAFARVTLAIGAAAAGLSEPVFGQGVSREQAVGVPKFEVDAAWPRIPNKWIFGPVTSIRVDEQDHVWILQRPRSVRPEEKAHVAPPGLEFDTGGNFLRGWGGPGEGYDWPENEHGFDLDPNGFVWITGNNPNFGGSKPDQTYDDMLLKFSKSGKFVLQVGGRNRYTTNKNSGSAKDTTCVHEPAECAYYRKTNEIFVADGYGNRRVIVFDGNSGKFKRMWGAFGQPPADQPANENYGEPGKFDGEGPDHFGIVHAVRVSNDGFVYVGDRDNRRVQVFTLDGKYLKQVFVNMAAGPSRTACGVTFSPDAHQQYMYVCDFDHGIVFVFNRETLALLGSFATKGKASGQLVDPHYLATDSKGNVYSAETAGGRRAQKFTFKGV